MIIYIFNNYFPDNGGFSKRCLKEIEIISIKQEIIVLCRGKQRDLTSTEFKTKYRTVKVFYFYPYFKINEKIVNYNKNLSGIYEIIRNIGLTLSIANSLIQLLWKFRNKHPIKLYCVVSPLTVPIIALLIGNVFKAMPFIIEFHDLEPELAKHIKKLNEKNIVMKIEYILERLVCRIFKNVIVTNNTQAHKIIKRTGIDKNKVYVIPNSIQAEYSVKSKSIYDSKQIKDKFILGYISSMSYAYNVDGLISLINMVSTRRSYFKNIKIIVIGDGDLLKDVKSITKKRHVNDIFIFTGKINNVADLLIEFHVALIPWKKNAITETILPTKLFDYMRAKKSIIAPNFGEFKTTLRHNSNALLFNNTRELVRYIYQLKKDTDLRHKLGENAFKDFEKYYNPEIYNKQIQNIINQ